MCSDSLKLRIAGKRRTASLQLQQKGLHYTRTCGDEAIHDVDIVRVNEVDAVGVDAVLRRGHPQVLGLDVGAPCERQVVLLAVLQGDALHADPLAILEVKSLQMEDQNTVMLLLLLTGGG